MTRRAYLYFALTFTLGAAVGACGTLLYAWYGGHWHRPFNKQRVVSHLTKELGLSEAQVGQVNQIFDDSSRSYSELHRQVDPQFDSIRHSTRDRIRQILTPEQLAKFNQMVRQFDERRKQGPPP